jgi:hypothetical protein
VQDWNASEASDAFVVGYFGVAHLPENGMMRPARGVWGAGVFEPVQGWPMLWRYQEGQGAVHAVHKVYCGTRRSLWLASEDARDWALQATRELEDGAESEIVVVGRLADFEARTGGLLRPTMRAVPELEPVVEPAEPGGMGDWELWDWERDGPVAQGEAVVTREAPNLREP